ncbi:TonB C-terminal domain-containing protein [Alphaproteobacteria bacterium]|nr:TonB C-terminal domain-containing protein [Alphaproteobacteria bacterium]
MFKSTFISIGLHVFFIIFAYYGLPSFKIKEPIESPIDIVEDTPTSSKTSLKLGETKVKEVKEIKKVIKKEKVKKTPPPPPAPSKNMVEKKNAELKKKKEIREIAELIKKKPKLKKKKVKKVLPPKVEKKPEKIKNKQKENLAKGILNTLTKPKKKVENSKKVEKEHNNTEILKKIKKIAGNSNRQVQQTEIKLSVTDINKIQNHVTKYWNVSYAASEVKMVITLKISTNVDGSIKSVKIYDKNLYQKDKFYRATADTARRAVLDSSPLPLPKGKEKKFENFLFDFDTSFISNY